MTRALVAMVAVGCAGAPQAKDEAMVMYRAMFEAEPGVSTKVVFPFPVDGAASQIEAAMGADGGFARLEAAPEGLGLALDGRGRVEVKVVIDRLKGLGTSAAPEAALSRPVPGGGLGDRYVRVNKGGSASVNVEFEYRASRDCGAGCGGARSWRYSGAVGLALQEVAMSYEETTR